MKETCVNQQDHLKIYKNNLVTQLRNNLGEKRVLIIEDSSQDTELVLRQLRSNGSKIIHQRVEQEKELVEALNHNSWDIIISDFNLPGFDAFNALEILNQTKKDIPLIIISGTIGEETAVELMKLGAKDFIKKDHLKRLVPAIDREIVEARIRQEDRVRQRSLALLAKLGEALSSKPFDYETTLKKVCRLAIEQLAVWCQVQALSERDGALNIVTAYLNLPEGHQVCELEMEASLTKNKPTILPCALKTGRPEIIHNSEPDFLRPNELLLVRRLAVKSFLSVPLLIAGRTFGAITLGSSVSSYDESDVHLAEEFASRFALALDNAQLLKQSQIAIKTRDEFLSIASHELKTPITSLKLQIEITRRQVNPNENKAPSPEKLEKILKVSQNQINRLSALVEDLLDVSRINAGKLTFAFETIDLSALVREIVEQHSEVLKAAQCNPTLKAKTPIFCECDRFRIEQVITNLLSNAIKYGAAQPIFIQVSENQDRAKILIKDSGVGIHHDQLDHIFERFVRAISPKNISGLGLGLYISKEIVRSHHGEIRVKSDLGKGSEFIVEIPLSQKSNLASVKAASL